MIGWLCCSGLSEGAQVWTGSPRAPWYLMSDRWSKVILIIACRHSAVFFAVLTRDRSSVLMLADSTDRGLPTCERSSSFGAHPCCHTVVLRCPGWHTTRRMYLWWDGCCSSSVHVDQICELSLQRCQCC
jgi:hypothetical protein